MNRGLAYSIFSLMPPAIAGISLFCESSLLSFCNLNILLDKETQIVLINQGLHQILLLVSFM